MIDERLVGVDDTVSCLDIGIENLVVLQLSLIELLNIGFRVTDVADPIVYFGNLNTILFSQYLDILAPDDLNLTEPLHFEQCVSLNYIRPIALLRSDPFLVFWTLSYQMLD